MSNKTIEVTIANIYTERISHTGTWPNMIPLSPFPSRVTKYVALKAVVWTALSCLERGNILDQESQWPVKTFSAKSSDSGGRRERAQVSSKLTLLLGQSNYTLITSSKYNLNKMYESFYYYCIILWKQSNVSMISILNPF